MGRFRKRAMSVVAAIGLGATLVPLMGVSPAAAAPGAQPAPTVSPNPVPTASSTFGLSNGTCDGTGGAGWRVQTFIIEAGTNVSTLNFDQGFPAEQVGADRDASDGVIRSPLWKGGSPGTGYIPAGTPAGLINPADLSGFSFSSSGWNLVDGPYQIGFACMAPGVTTPNQWWVQTVTIDTTPGGGTSFLTQGVPAPAPAIDSVTVDNGQLVIAFTGTGADSFTAQATTTSGDYSSPVGSSTTATTDASDITISGLSNGTSYFVRVLGNKAGFNATPSAQSGPHIPQTNGGAVQNLTETDSGTDDAGSGPFVDVDWNAPAAVGGCTVTGYTVGVTPAGTPVQPDPSPTGTGTGGSARITGVPTNTSITVTVTPTFAPGCVGTSASVPAFVATGNVVIQDIDVNRPVGALVLTQVCGTNGVLPAEGAQLGFASLPIIPAVNPSTVGNPSTPVGGAPSLIVDPAGGTASDQAPGTADPAYAAYPYPTAVGGAAAPASETHCGLDLGVADLVRDAAGAGQFFAAQAAISQITIVDTRNVDLGWTVTGEMEDFVATSEDDDGTGTGALDSFSGDFLGWTPVVSEDTPAYDNDANPGTANYDQQAVAGAPVVPSTVNGLGDGATLALADPGEGLGTAILDARVKLLIPLTADAGLYEGSLRFSAL